MLYSVSFVTREVNNRRNSSSSTLLVLVLIAQLWFIIHQNDWSGQNTTTHNMGAQRGLDLMIITHANFAYLLQHSEPSF